MKNIYTHLYTQDNILKLSPKHPRIAKMLYLASKIKTHPKKILDIGCNDGTLLQLLGQKYPAAKLNGLDADTKSINRCQKKGIGAKIYFFDDKTPIPFPDHSFDLIIAGEIIEHIYNTDMFLDEVHRLLTPKGYLLLTTPNIASLGRRLMLMLGINPLIEVSPNRPDSCGHIRYFTFSTLKNLIVTHNFKINTVTSDVVNFDNRGKVNSKQLAKIFPKIGQSIISLSSPR